MTPHKAWPSSPWHLKVFRAQRDAAVLAVIRLTCGPQERVLLKVTPRAVICSTLQVRMDWRVIKDFGRALMDDHLT